MARLLPRLPSSVLHTDTDNFDKDGWRQPPDLGRIDFVYSFGLNQRRLGLRGKRGKPMSNEFQPSGVVRMKSGRLIAVAAALAALLIFSTEAFAQRQPTTCSDARQMCLVLTGKNRKPNPNGCRIAFASCMKTGTWVGLEGLKFSVAKK